MLKLKEKKSILLAIFLVLIVSIAGTFAWFSWRSNDTALSLIVGEVDGLRITLKPYQISATMTPVDNYDEEDVVYTDVKAVNNDSDSLVMSLYYLVEDIDDVLITEDFKYTITKSTDGGNTYSFLTDGSFNELEGNKLIVLEEEIPSNTTYMYKVYAWLYNTDEDQSQLQGAIFDGELRAEISEVEPTTALTLIANANPTTLMYANATEEQKGNMWTFNQAETVQVPATTDYRFIGESPNNWIKFNGEEDWRIIGVFDNKIKIIKNTSIGNYSFDYKQNGVGSSESDYGSNDWTDSQLMYMLNTPIYKNSDGTYNTTLITQELLNDGYTISDNFIKDNKTTPNIIYELGKVPASIATGATSYSGSDMTWELNETAISKIEKTTFYLGGTSSINNSASTWYNVERGINTPNSNTNPTSWTGYVGLMYPSDYAYTYAYGVDDTCFNNTSIFSCTVELGVKSWLYKDISKSSSNPWTISPYSVSANTVFYVYSDYAIFNHYSASNTFVVHPSIYLKSGTLLSGKGTQQEPYRIIEQ